MEAILWIMENGFFDHLRCAYDQDGCELINDPKYSLVSEFLYGRLHNES